MTIEKDVSESLGEGVREVDTSGDVIEGDDLAGRPLLDSEVLNIDVASTFGGLAGIGEMATRDVVPVDHGRTVLFDVEFVQDGSEVLDRFGAVDGCHEFGLGRAGSDGREPFCLVVYGRTTESNNEGAGRSACGRAGGVGGVEVCPKLVWPCWVRY